MSIEGVKFCDLCGGAIGRYDITPMKVGEEGHVILLHLHNRHRGDCLAQKLTQLADQYAMGMLAALSDGNAQEPVQHQA